MKSFVKRCGDIWKNIRQSPAKIPSKVAISPDNTDEREMLGAAFQKDEHYFQVLINEMYLTYGREWFKEYDPMVFVVSEFIYDKEMEVVPFIVGPKMMEKFGKKVPKGMIFSNTRVAGLHPYSGGNLALSVVLCRVKRGDYARKLLQVVESAASVLDFAIALSTYVKVAGIVLDGVEALFGLGDTDPLIGFRKEFNPDAGDVLKPSYFVLIDMPESELNINELWVSEHQLLYGKHLKKAKPFRDANFVLYSIAQTTERYDEKILPFYPQWERVVMEATVPTKNNWQSAKANMLSLYQTLMLSPDLTPKQAYKLNEKYKVEMKRLYDNAVEMAELGKEKKKPSELDKFRNQSLDILKM